MEAETIPCRICGEKTPMLGTKLCDRCWELESRILAAPCYAVKIINEFHAKRDKALDELTAESQKLGLY